jgi:hypothetical protein
MVEKSDITAVAKWGGLAAIAGILVWGMLQIVEAITSETTTNPPIVTDDTVLIDYEYGSGLSVSVLDDRVTFEAKFNSGSDRFDPSTLTIVREYIAKGYRLSGVTVNGVALHVDADDNGWMSHDNWHQVVLKVLGTLVYSDEFREQKHEDVKRSASVKAVGPVDISAQVGARTEWHTAQSWTDIKSIKLTGTIELKK